MLIKNLNAVFRKRHRLIFGIFTVIVIISFVFMGYGRMGNDGGSGAAGEVGVAFGRSVSRADLYEISRRLAVLCEAFQGGSRELPAEQLLGVYCMLAKARQLGLSASDKEVAAMLRKLPFLQKDGKFDLTCKLPENYTLQVINVRGTTINATMGRIKTKYHLPRTNSLLCVK